MKQNCWEFKNCGRDSEGKKAEELGICPATTDERLNGVHGGKNAGRACWVIAGTMCGGQVQGTFANKYKNCEVCDFYKKVFDKERANYQFSIILPKRLKS